MSARLLSRWGVIGVQGEDSVAFLQAQLSNDVAGMAESQLRMAALCTAKGRMLGSFFILRKANDVFLVCRREIIPALVKRLNMFVLRSKCKVRDCTADHPVAYLAETGLTAPMKVSWADDGTAQASLRATHSMLPGFALLTDIPPQAGPEADDEFEFMLQQLGLAYVNGSTVEMFIPQAVNFDLIGGISFSKGCYPGQEVVARSHYLGKVKRRVFQATAAADAPLTAGLDVWLSGKDNEPAGQIATAVLHAGQHHLLVDLPLEDAEQAGSAFVVRLDNTEVQLAIQAPPYDVHQKGNLFENA